MRRIKIKNEEIFYILRKSRRSRNISLAVNSRAEITLSLPWNLPEKFGVDFLVKKSEWLFKKIAFYKNRINLIPRADFKDYQKNKKSALETVNGRIKTFNAFYKFPVNKISIRNQKTRWGSCSRNGNLSFSYRVAYLPEELQNYVVVHELCHLGQFNHSNKFWNLVGETIPNYKEIRKKMRNF